MSISSIYRVDFNVLLPLKKIYDRKKCIIDDIFLIITGCYINIMKYNFKIIVIKFKYFHNVTMYN